MRVLAVPFSLFPSGGGSSPSLVALGCFVFVADNLRTVPHNAFGSRAHFRPQDISPGSVGFPRKPRAGGPSTEGDLEGLAAPATTCSCFC